MKILNKLRRYFNPTFEEWLEDVGVIPNLQTRAKRIWDRYNEDRSLHFLKNFMTKDLYMVCGFVCYPKSCFPEKYFCIMVTTDSESICVFHNKKLLEEFYNLKIDEEKNKWKTK